MGAVLRTLTALALLSSLALLAGLALPLHGAAAAAEPSLRLAGQEPPNLLDVHVGPRGAALQLDARVALARDAPLYVKLVPAPDARNAAYMNGTVSVDHRAALGGWTHHLSLRDAHGQLVARDGHGKPAEGDLGHHTGNQPTAPVWLGAGTWKVRSVLSIPADAASTEGVQVQVRYHIALRTGEGSTGNGGGVQDPAVAAEWNLRVLPGGADLEASSGALGPGGPARDVPLPWVSAAAGLLIAAAVRRRA